MPAGTNDVAVLSKDSSGNFSAAKFFRAQTVPGTINGGNAVVLGPADSTTMQTITTANVPAGYAEPQYVSRPAEPTAVPARHTPAG